MDGWSTCQKRKGEPTYSATCGIPRISNMADEDDERRHLSPDSSTQVLPQNKHKHKKKKKHKHKSKRRKKKHSDADRESSDEVQDSVNESSAGSVEHTDEWVVDSELVLDIKPLTEYIEDRKELNDELFKIMGRKEMKKLMPRSVKKLDEDELKSQCLHQLEVISKKRLLNMIEGREMSSSSSESEHEDDVKGAAAKESDQQNVAAAKESDQQNVAAASYLPLVPKIQDESMNILGELSLVPDQNEIDELIEGDTEAKEPTVYMEPAVGQEIPKQELIVVTESQLLELEYRARALKSMVQAQQRLET